MAAQPKKTVIDSVSEDLSYVLPLIGRSIRKKLLMTALMQFEEDITPPHFAIMKQLQESGTLHVAEIGERVEIARPQMTRLIDKLVELDLVERETCTEDRRMLNITLTAKAKAILEEHDNALRNATTDMLSGLTDDELKELSTALTTLKDIFSRL